VNEGTSPLAGLDFALVGPGRVGSSLAHWAVARGATCLAVVGPHGSSRARALGERLGATVVGSIELTPEEAKLILIAVPDSRIGEVARRLAAPSRRRSVALHTSGAFGAGVLAPLGALGCRVGTLHPLRAFPAVEEDVAAAAGVFFALDGDAEARALGRRLAEAFGGESGIVSDELRPLYHFAATLAAGGAVTMLATAHALGRRIGLPEAALRGYGQLARGAIAAAISASQPATAITGPAARGDLATVERHFAALAASAPEMVPLAVEVARAALARCAEAGPLEPAQRALLERLQRADLLDRSKDRVLASDRPQPA
jgi:predicted short-subunit dehydrogenase-like oxidoreductase (DUF2520 family)